MNSIFAYTRAYNGQCILVVCNFYDKEVEFNLPEDINVNEVNMIISNYGNKQANINSIVLKAYESFSCYIR